MAEVGSDIRGEKKLAKSWLDTSIKTNNKIKP